MDQALIVAAHAPVAADPGEGSLHDPPALEHVKAARDDGRCLSGSDPDPLQAGPPMLADRQRPSQCRREPGFQALVGAVSPEQCDGEEL